MRRLLLAMCWRWMAGAVWIYNAKMKTLTIFEQGLSVFYQNDYVTAGEIWFVGNAFINEEETALKSLMQRCEALKQEGVNNAWILTIQSAIYLEPFDFFEDDREVALMQALTWAKAAITLDPSNYAAQRCAGSANYWLDDEIAALPYYEKSHYLRPSPTLAIRVWKIKNLQKPHPDYALLQIAMDGDNALEYYNAGVELNQTVNTMDDATSTEYTRLLQLKVACYRRAYHLYKAFLVQKNGNFINNDGHTFAMCCNNLASISMGKNQYADAINFCNEGLTFSYFLYLIQNRFNCFANLGKLKEANDDGIKIIDDFLDEIGLNLYFEIAEVICKYHQQINDFKTTLEWANDAIESYDDLEDEDKNDDKLIHYYGNFWATKSNAESKLGIVHPSEHQNAYHANVSSPSEDALSLLNRGIIFYNQSDFEQANQYFIAAQKSAIASNDLPNLKAALYNSGMVKVAHLNDAKGALIDFEQAIKTGLADFATYYWGANSCYILQRHETCIDYCKHAIALIPSTPSLNDSMLAWLYMFKGIAEHETEQYAAARDSYLNSLKYEEIDVVRENYESIKYSP